MKINETTKRFPRKSEATWKDVSYAVAVEYFKKDTKWLFIFRVALLFLFVSLALAAGLTMLT